MNEAAQKTVESLRKSWQHHFGIRVILGKEFETGEVDESREIISTDKMLTYGDGDLPHFWGKNTSSRWIKSNFNCHMG